MAVETEIIIPTGQPAAAPFKYVVIPSQMVEPETITALFDGSAAGAAFWPCCSVYSQDGILLGRYIPPASVAAGDKAEVTYGPF